jgi:DNA-binding MltR family transcriptional regulator
MPKSRVKLQPIHFDDFYGTMDAESDRSCVLIACHVLDVALEYRLRFHFSRRRRVIKKAIDPLFESTRPLSSFSAKILTAYSLSLLDDWAFDDLTTLRMIRNKLAAHSHSAFSFQAPEVGPLIYQLRSTRLALANRGRAWSLTRARQHFEGATTPSGKSPRFVYFAAGFHYLHGYLTKGIPYKRRTA